MSIPRETQSKPHLTLVFDFSQLLSLPRIQARGGKTAGYCLTRDHNYAMSQYPCHICMCPVALWFHCLSTDDKFKVQSQVTSRGSDDTITQLLSCSQLPPNTERRRQRRKGQMMLQIAWPPMTLLEATWFLCVVIYMTIQFPCACKVQFCIKTCISQHPPGARCWESGWNEGC